MVGAGGMEVEEEEDGVVGVPFKVLGEVGESTGQHPTISILMAGSQVI